MEINDKLQICKVVAQAIISDLQVTDAEHEFLTSLMNRYELTDEQRKEVMARNIDDDPKDLAEGITEFDSKNELLVELAMAVAADGQLSNTERQLIREVAAALDVPEADVDMLVKTALTD